VLVTQDGPVLTLSLNRTARLNAVSTEMYEQLLAGLDRADDDPAIRAVVLTGEGRAFCVGADQKAHGAGTRTPEQRQEYVELAQQVCERIQTLSVPVVAAVHGYALGAGAEMATSADFLVIADDAQMAFPEVAIGTFVGGGVTHRLPRLVGLRRATELLLLGRRFDGTQALEWGLAFACAPTGHVRDLARELARELAVKAPLSMAAMKAALWRDQPLGEAMESEEAELLLITGTRDWAEGVEAFAQRREPRFVGW
jgi:enoyl-CoA hydratase